MQFDENNIGQKISVNDFNEVFFADNMETSCGLVLSNLGEHSIASISTGSLGPPKGHVEDDDEDHIATVRRELEEETGISDVEFVPGFVKEAVLIQTQRKEKCQAGVLVFGRNRENKRQA